MIDPKLLPSRPLLDTGILIRGLGVCPDANAAVCEELFKALLQHEKDILITAPSFAEMLCAHKQQQLPRTAHVEVVGFDRLSAEEFRNAFPSSVLRQQADKYGVSRQWVKYDAMIVACAKRHGADCIVSLDAKALPKCAEALGVPVEVPKDFEPMQQVIPSMAKILSLPTAKTAQKDG